MAKNAENMVNYGEIITKKRGIIMGVSDTIAAIITAPGRAAVGIIRLSGPEAVAVASAVYEGKADLAACASHTIHFGWVRDPANGRRIDEALFLLMRGPKSYTGEDVVEIQSHGGHVSTQEILRLLLRQGVRLADAGEFTKRAFINGKLDLTRAEAVMDIVDAESDAALSQALAQKSGVLEERIRTAREAVLELVAFIQADLDYPEDDIERLSDEELAARVDAVRGDLAALIATAQRGRMFREGIKMVIMGAPNVGKSSLLNALLGRERAIVTDIAGTTRDVVTEHLTIHGVPVEILDTAGIRATDDQIEAIGVERAKAASREADVVLYVVASDRGLSEEDHESLRALADKATILVANKSDLAPDAELPDNVPTVRISAKLQEGIEALEETVAQCILADDRVGSGDEAVVSNARHLALLERCAADLDSFLEGLSLDMSKDILVIDLQNAWENLGLITGDTASEDLIDTIFSKFCLGK